MGAKDKWKCQSLLQIEILRTKKGWFLSLFLTGKICWFLSYGAGQFDSKHAAEGDLSWNPIISHLLRGYGLSKVASFGNRTSIIHMRQIFLLDTIYRDELTFVTKYSGPGLDQTKIDKTLVWSILGTEEKTQIWQIWVETRDHVWPISRLFFKTKTRVCYWPS